MRSFASDNNSGVHPLVMKALNKANENHAIAYGDDPWTKEAIERIKNEIGPEVDPYFSFNGTGANVTALRLATKCYHTIFCAETAHIYVDECNAPATQTGCNIRAIATKKGNGKLTPELIAPHIYGIGDQHHAQPRIIYISQCTEMGTVYTLEELKSLRKFANEHHLYILMDGARIANACVALNCSLREMIVNTGMDLVAFGGTKNGLMIGECLLVVNDIFKEEAKFVRKNTTQLASKMRYMSCQFTAYLEKNLWKECATNANRLAKRLYTGLKRIEGIKMTQPLESNQLFLTMPRPVINKLQKDYFFYFWNEAKDEIRFVTSWDTTEEDVDALLASIKRDI